MKKDVEQEAKTVDLYEGSTIRGTKIWNMLKPTIMEIELFKRNKWLIIKLEGKEYITDRAILKGVI